MLARLPLALPQNPGRPAVAQIRKPVRMAESQLERIEVVFETDQPQRPHRPQARHFLITQNRRHRVRRSSQADIPHHQRRGLGGVLCRIQREPFPQKRLLHIQRARLLHGRGARMHNFAGSHVPNARKPLEGRVHLVVAQRERGRLLAFHLRVLHRVIEVVLLQKHPLGLVQRQKTVRQNALPDLSHEPVVEIDVVLPQQLPPERFLRLRQMMQIRPAVTPTRGTSTVRVERFLRKLVHPASQLEKSPRSKRPAPLRHLRRNNAVKHVHAPVHRLQNVQRRPHPHQIPRVTLRKQRRRVFTDVFPRLFPLPNRQPPNGESIKRHSHQTLRALLAQLRKKRPLHNPKHRLRRIPSGRQTPGRPPMRDPHRLPRRRLRCGRGNTLVEHHHDVAPNRLLRFHTHLRTEQNRLPIQITLKNRALLPHHPRMRQRKNLEPARIRQHRALPAHETVNAARAPKHLRPRPQ